MASLVIGHPPISLSSTDILEIAEVQTPETLLGNPLLPTIIYMEIHRREKDVGLKEIARITSNHYWSLRTSAVCAKVMDRPEEGSDSNTAGKTGAWKLFMNQSH